MASRLTAALFFAISLSSIPVLAAKPMAISFESEWKGSGEEPYKLYIVRCSNSELVPLTKWKGNSWCVGEESRENCHSRQMKAAEAACDL
jgi:hypothetical protein